MTKKFRVLIRGHDPSAGINADGEPRVGFWTTRRIEAVSRAEAARIAVDLVATEKRLRKVAKTSWGGPPILVADEVEEVSSFGGNPVPVAGYTFFQEAEEPH